MIQSIDDGRTWFEEGGGVALVIVISNLSLRKHSMGGSHSLVYRIR